MQTGPDHLLEKVRAEGLSLGVCCSKTPTPRRPLVNVGEGLAIIVCVPFRGTTDGIILLGTCRRDILVLELTDNVPIILSSHATQKLERHDEEDDSDARTGKHAPGGDMP